MWNKPYSEYISCQDCGYYFKPESVFVKTYKDTAICLCKKCAEKLCNEIEKSLGIVI